MKADEDNDAWLRSLCELAREARGQQAWDGGHPAAEDLTAYHAGELTGDQAEEIQEHLAVCRQCSRLLLDLPAFLEPMATTASAASPEAAAWQRFRTRLPAPATSREKVVGRWRRITTSPGLAYLLAACLALALVGGPMWRLVQERREPRPATLHLYLPVSPRGIPDLNPVPRLRLGTASRTYLVLHLPEHLPRSGDEEIHAVLRSETGEVQNLHDSLIETGSPVVVLVLEHRRLAAGRYHIQVARGQDDGAPLVDYEFQVAAP